jgi:O-Antigen ligase
LVQHRRLYSQVKVLAAESLLMTRRDTSPRLGAIALLSSFAIFLAFCIFGGGASRLDAQSQPLILLAGIMCGLVAIWTGTLAQFRAVRTPLLFLMAFALIVAVQLLPLPPAIWTALPGHELYAQAAAVAGIPQPWRPISLTPDLTWATFLSLLPPLALVLAFAVLDEAHKRRAVPLLVGVIFFSGMLGLAQVSGGSGGALRFYTVTNPDSAVGLFANRNHQALLLVLGLPMLGAWVRIGTGDPKFAQARYWSAVGVGVFLIPLILVTGSRAGALLAIVGITGAWLLQKGRRDAAFVPRLYKSPIHIPRWIIALGLVSVILALLILTQATAIDRIFASNMAEEQRSQLLTPLFDMARAFFPTGSGFGSFDSVYRAFEPFELLNPSYLNQAHNDLLQLMIEGGLPALLLLIVFLIWWGARARLHWASAKRISSNRIVGRLGSIMVLIILVASLVDYPLRTPMVAVIFTLALLWMADSPERNLRALSDD